VRRGDPGSDRIARLLGDLKLNRPLAFLLQWQSRAERPDFLGQHLAHGVQPNRIRATRLSMARLNNATKAIPKTRVTQQPCHPSSLCSIPTCIASYDARPAFALERLREIDAEHLLYKTVKPRAGGSVSLMLTPLELIERLAALIPPPRRQTAKPQRVAIRLSGPRMALVGRSPTQGRSGGSRPGPDFRLGFGDIRIAIIDRGSYR
jgi:hypothetical protein